MKKYKVEWTEHHSTIVSAKNVEQAREIAQLKDPSTTYECNDEMGENIEETT